MIAKSNTFEYKAWSRMMNRCYAPSVQLSQPSYIGCEVIAEWKDFENFRDWMVNQDWKGKVLDKDVLGTGKLYSPDTCAFILPKTNAFMTDRYNHRGDYPVGVHLHCGGKYQSRCGNGVDREHLGTYYTVKQAYSAYLLYKYQISLVLSDLETDTRVKVRLPEIFFNLSEEYYDSINN